MKLCDNVSILFGNKVVTDHVLETYRKKWNRHIILAGIGSKEYSDEKDFHAMLFELTPLSITRDKTQGPFNSTEQPRGKVGPPAGFESKRYTSTYYKELKTKVLSRLTKEEREALTRY